MSFIFISFKETLFFKHERVEYDFTYACGLYKFEFYQTHVGYATLGVMITIIDSIFDTYGSINEFIHFKIVLINQVYDFLSICAPSER